MARAKIAITLDSELLKAVDRLVASDLFPNRSQAIQSAVEEKLARMEQRRLARECAKLDPKIERALAEEGLSTEIRDWPEY